MSLDMFLPLSKSSTKPNNQLGPSHNITISPAVREAIINHHPKWSHLTVANDATASIRFAPVAQALTSPPRLRLR